METKGKMSVEKAVFRHVEFDLPVGYLQGYKQIVSYVNPKSRIKVRPGSKDLGVISM